MISSQITVILITLRKAFSYAVCFLKGKNTVQATAWFDNAYSDSALSKQMI